MLYREAGLLVQSASNGRILLLLLFTMPEGGVVGGVCCMHMGIVLFLFHICVRGVSVAVCPYVSECLHIYLSFCDCIAQTFSF